MTDLEKILEANIDTLTGDVEEMLRNKDENDILDYVGNMLTANGYTVSGSREGSVIVPAELSLAKSFEAFLPKDTVVKSTAASEGGKFKDRLRRAVCTNETLYDLMSKGNSTIKDYLKTGIPAVLGAIGVVVTTPYAWLVLLAAAAIALLIKIGYVAYCDGIVPASVQPVTDDLF